MRVEIAGKQFAEGKCTRFLDSARAIDRLLSYYKSKYPKANMNEKHTTQHLGI